MNEKVIIAIEAYHKMAAFKAESEELRITHNAIYKKKNGTHYIFYNETDDETSKTVSNIIKIKNKQLSIIKKGECNSTLIFEENKRNKSSYITSFGSFLMETDSKKVKLEINEESINIHLIYDLYLNGALSSNCKMEISVK